MGLKTLTRLTIHLVTLVAILFEPPLTALAMVPLRLEDNQVVTSLRASPSVISHSLSLESSPFNPASNFVSTVTEPIPVRLILPPGTIPPSAITIPDTKPGIETTFQSHPTHLSATLIPHLAPEDMFGNGSYGDLNVPVGTTAYANDARASIVGTALAEQPLVAVNSTAGWIRGDEVLLIQMQGVGAGSYEFGIIADMTATSLTFQQNLVNTYTVGGNSKAQALLVRHYQNITVAGTLSAHPWDGVAGGVAVFRVSNNLIVEPTGKIDLTGRGFRGGPPPANRGDQGGKGHQGESVLGLGSYDTVRNSCAGGGGNGDPIGLNHSGGGGGAGGHSFIGDQGANGTGGISSGEGGDLIGNNELSLLFAGCGGGSGGPDDNDTKGGAGGNGGGALILYAKNVNISGQINISGADGGNGLESSGGGGGGAGGSIRLVGDQLNVGNNQIISLGGIGGSSEDEGYGGNGSPGRIRLEYCMSLSGVTNPVASTQELNCVDTNYVILSGPTAGLSNTAYGFTAIVNPVTTTLPISYAWQATEQAPVTHSSGITDPITFTWNLPGTKLITITATTVNGTLADTHTIRIDNAANINLLNPLSLSPTTLNSPGGPVQAGFTVQNTSSISQTERFRARVRTGPVTFIETGPVTLEPGQTYTYNDLKNFSQVGIFEVTAEHWVGDTWLPLSGQGSGSIRVMAPPPPKPEQKKGKSKTSKQTKDPVDTSTGNYFYDFTDLSDPTPGLPLEVTRWYNSLDAPQINGPFGYGSSWTYGITVTWQADKTALVRMADGHLAYFVGELDPADPDNLAGLYLAQDDDIASLERYADDTGVLTLTDQTAYHFDPTGHLSHITHPYPAEITILYDNGRPVQLVHSVGVTYTLSYNGAYISQIESSTGRTVTYSYTPAGDLALLTRPDGSTYTYFYDANHRLTEARDPNGTAYIRNVYDGQGRVMTQYDHAGQVTTLTYGPEITMTRAFTDALGHVTLHQYDANYRLIQETDSLGQSMTYTYDAHGNVIAHQDKNGQLWQYTYDDRGNMLSETNPLGQTSTYTYDTRNNRTSLTNPLGHTTTYEYDVNNRLIRTTDPLGHIHDYEYDAQGNLIRERDETGAETRYAYNQLGLSTVITDALGHVSVTEYDAFGNRIGYTDAKGRAAQFFYDDLNRLVKSIDPLGTVIEFTYDPMGNLLTEADGMGHLKQYTYDVYDRVIAETDFKGQTTKYGYDALGHRTAMTDTLGFATHFTYDAVGNLIAQQDKVGAITQYAYDPAGHLIRETDSLGRVTEYRYDAAGRQVEARRPCAACSGSVAVSQTFYDAVGQVVKEIDPRGAVTLYTYDALGRQATTTDANGHATASTYDPAGQLIQEVDPLGGITRYAYDALGQQTSLTDARGAQTMQQYDAVGNVTKVIDPRGNSVTTVYDANDRPVTLTDPRGNSTQQSYDAAGRLTSVTNPLGQVTSYTYDANGNQSAVTDPLGHTTQTEYDALNRPVRVTDALGHITSFTYDPMGRLTATTDALGRTTQYTYDSAGRKLTSQDPLGHTTTYTYDSADNLITSQDPTGVTTTYGYDATGNRLREVDPLGNPTDYSYDLLGNRILLRDALGRETHFGYDALNRLVEVTDPAGHKVQYTYDPVGHLTSQKDANSHMTTFVYDAAGNLTSTTNPLGATWSYVYDQANNQTKQTKPDGVAINQQYDALNRLVKTDYSDTTPDVSLSYDAAGNLATMADGSGLTSYSYDALNRLISLNYPGRQQVSYTYDAIGNRTGVTTSGGMQTTYVYDGADLLQSVTTTEGTMTYSYDARGLPLRLDYPNGAFMTWRYDTAGRLIEVNNGNAAGVFAGYNYTLNAMGNKTQELRTLATPNGPATITTNYAYNSLDQLTRSSASDGLETRYIFDPAGNRLQMSGLRSPADVTVQTLQPYTITYSYNAANQLLTASDSGLGMTTYSYNLNGARTAQQQPSRRMTYAYDAADRLISASSGGSTGGGPIYLPIITKNAKPGVGTSQADPSTPTDNASNPQPLTPSPQSPILQPSGLPTLPFLERYTYDGQGRRISKQQLDSQTSQILATRTYLYSDGWPALLEQATTASQTHTTRYAYDVGLTRLQAVVDGQPGYFHTDGLGSVVDYSGSGGGLLDDDLNVYDDYGRSTAGGLDAFTPSAYTGHEADPATGLTYARHRYYDSTTGAFLTPDPYPANYTDPLDLHRYAYVQGNPINMTDPLGLFNWQTQMVERGDTLSAIAQKWGTTVDELVRLNKIKNRNLIYPGQKINLPSCKSAKCQGLVAQQKAKTQGTSAPVCGEKLPFNYTLLEIGSNAPELFFPYITYTNGYPDLTDQGADLLTDNIAPFKESACGASRKYENRPAPQVFGNEKWNKQQKACQRHDQDLYNLGKPFWRLDIEEIRNIHRRLARESTYSGMKAAFNFLADLIKG